MTRGTLRIYLGAAPGVGKTYAMLSEAHRRRERGTDAVVVLVETHGRAHTAAMRRRMAHGDVYRPDQVDAALAHYFRVGNLTALRELALLWVADRVDEQLETYRAEHRIGVAWETRERVVVALTGGPEGDTLV